MTSNANESHDSAADTPGTARQRHVEGRLQGVGDIELYWRGWLPDSEPQAVVVFAHGSLEHGERHPDLRNSLTRAGIAVYAVDFRGHGRSRGRPGHIRSMAWVVDDLDKMWRQATSLHDQVPAFLLGYSFGAMVALEHVLHAESKPAGMVLVSTGIDVSAVPPLQAKIARLLSAVTPNLPMIEAPSSDMSRDPEVVRAYEDDPLVFHGRAPARTVGELLASIERVAPRLGEVRVPLLVIHGGSDVVANPEGGRLVHAETGSADKTLSIFDGLFHDVFNEPERKQVIDVVVRWILDRI